MKNHLKISDLKIANPCPVLWETMDAHPDGKFCRACSKTVYDFTESTEEEINKILIGENNKGKICCSFYVDQLPQEKQPFATSFKFKLAFAFGFSLLSFILLKPQDLQAQNIKPDLQNEAVNIFPVIKNTIDSLYPVCRIDDITETAINKEASSKGQPSKKFKFRLFVPKLVVRRRLMGCPDF